MKLTKVLLTAIFVAGVFGVVPVFAQPVVGHFISVGVVGGMGLTDAFSNQTILGVDTSTHLYSRSKDYIVGPSLEVRLPMHLSVEADGLYRPLTQTGTNTVIPLGTYTYSRTINSWEFPALVKYKFPIPLVRPFVEAGPSFRHVGQYFGNLLSEKGFTAGVGADLHLGPVHVDPQVRYTRWGNDSNPTSFAVTPKSNANQAELLLGISF